MPGNLLAEVNCRGKEFGTESLPHSAGLQLSMSSSVSRRRQGVADGWAGKWVRASGLEGKLHCRLVSESEAAGFWGEVGWVFGMFLRCVGEFSR